ncbi:HPr kinase/phosphorylase [Tritonibacter multivorans]|uniref:HPr kinase/phosphorylase n=2 Tax=Tritonibacter multivorans TaxID=928856 RepID=A0A0P1GZ43_9RHOB|nr:HPr kinase/phosphorylase [Tritonibacter multivorans]SFD25931.1 Hpr(Ser) kinase/phosphatase [Tritonibacter multivorans]
MILHASCVSLAGRGVLIRGASGAGKSALALELMARGAGLVADDRCEIHKAAGGVIARAPNPIAGLIEARGVGILRADHVAQAQLHVIVDLDHLATDRLPRHLEEEILGCALPVLHRVDAPHFAASLIQYLKCGAIDPDAGQ